MRNLTPTEIFANIRKGAERSTDDDTRYLIAQGRKEAEKMPCMAGFVKGEL